MSGIIGKELVKATNERVFYFFREISKIPRGSGNEKAIADYLVAFGNAKGFAVRRSTAVVNGKQTHDVVLSKPAAKGHEHLETVILQAHIDMVCQKTKESGHNFETDPIEIIVDGDKMTADGTTLGADDGIGVACSLAILDSADIPHPPIEALFTSDEEDGMTGAIAANNTLVTGKRLINIDTETEGILYYGCAGGVDANFYLPVTYEPTPDGLTFIQIELSGLLGGHSGVEIHKKRANAHKLMARALSAAQTEYPLYVAEFTGGDKRNVITREATVLTAVEHKNVEKMIALIKEQKDIFVHEYEGIESSIELSAKAVAEPRAKVLSRGSLDQLLSAILVIPNDVQAMHGKVEGLVETSCNLGIVRQEADRFYLCSLIRSFYKTKKKYVLEQMRRLAELLGAEFSATDDYPDWEPNPASELIARFLHAYHTAFEKDPELMSIHAGLECGYFTEKFPYMDMIACGPTLRDVHTPDETLYLESTEKVVELLITVLNQMDEEPPSRETSFTAAESAAPDHSHICRCIR